MIASLQLGLPLGLAALLAPVLFLIAARERGRAQPRLVGSLEIWRRVAVDRPVSSRARRAPLTPRIWLIALAMALAALAICQPTWTHPAEPRVWRVVLDTAPSNSLKAGDQTRFDLALAGGVQWTDQNFGDARVLWIGAALAGGAPEMEDCAPGESPSVAFVGRARNAAARRNWDSFDALDCLWLPTSGAGREPRYAMRPKLNYAGAPGPVKDLGGQLGLWWAQGETLVEAPLAASTGAASIHLSGSAVQSGSVLGEFAELWANARGLEVLRGAAPSETCLLEVHGPTLGSGAGSKETATGSLGQDGWLAVGTWPEAVEVPGEDWLVHRGQRLIGTRPGHIDLALTDLSGLSGDPAAFAVSMAGLFDSASLPGLGIVSVAERLPATLTALGGKSAMKSSGVGTTKQTPLAPGLAILAACLLFGISYQSGRLRSLAPTR